EQSLTHTQGKEDVGGERSAAITDERDERDGGNDDPAPDGVAVLREVLVHEAEALPRGCGRAPEPTRELTVLRAGEAL
uniref:Uncharacterized protein n=1 Tax=Oryza brachyantha TaxID=4533 RepID=J3LMQ9_ORYBR